MANSNATESHLMKVTALSSTVTAKNRKGGDVRTTVGQFQSIPFTLMVPVAMRTLLSLSSSMTSDALANKNEKIAGLIEQLQKMEQQRRIGEKKRIKSKFIPSILIL